MVVESPPLSYQQRREGSESLAGNDDFRAPGEGSESLAGNYDFELYMGISADPVSHHYSLRNQRAEVILGQN